MKRFTSITAAVVIVLVGALLYQQEAASQPADRAAIEKQILANERAINAAFAKGDAVAFMTNISKDGLGIDMMGISTVAALEKMLPQAKIEATSIDTTQFHWVSPQTVILLYRWTGKGTFAGMPVPSPVWASTVWTNRDGKWLAVFHQETPAAPPLPTKK